VVLDLETARAAFDASTDFTVGVEEEFALLDPAELGLVSRYDELRRAADADPVLAPSVSGELISSEIEIRSGRGEDRSAVRAAAVVRARRRAGHRARIDGNASLV
jgi:carboxylate-amine ligase